MAFPFPSVRLKCLLCGLSGRCRWKGYFTRQVLHAGHCQTRGCDFCYFPDFLIPGRRLSRASWKKFIEVFQETKIIRDSIDGLLVGLDCVVDFTMALSSAYNFLYAAVRALRINHVRLSILAPEKSSVFVFYNLKKHAIKNIFTGTDYVWHSFHYMSLHPP
jgi:hypothetical protein